jgi:hypothetical protein
LPAESRGELSPRLFFALRVTGKRPGGARIIAPFTGYHSDEDSAMRRLALGIILATIATYAAGFLYWGVSALPYSAWSASRDDVAAGQALLSYFPERGTYFLPARTHEPAELSRLAEAGPIAFVHMLHPRGRAVMDPAIMIRGLLLVLVSCGLIAAILRTARAALPTYGGRVALAAMIGFTAVFVIDLGEVVWWEMPLRWKFYQGVYDFSAFLVPGLVLARFVDGAQVIHHGAAVPRARSG